MGEQSIKTILIIEDEPIFRMNYRTVIINHGYRVNEAGTGQQGLQLLEAEKPDAVLLDLILPEVNGYEVLKKIREVYPKLPIIIFSVMGAEADMKRAFELGADDYVIKGMESPTAILEKLDALI